MKTITLTDSEAKMLTMLMKDLLPHEGEENGVAFLEPYEVILFRKILEQLNNA